MDELRAAAPSGNFFFQLYVNRDRAKSAALLRQCSANPNIKATIKDRYFNAAAATPANVFPTLINLAQKHMKKLRSNSGLFKVYDKQIADLLSRLGENYPVRLNLAQQGSFQLGYYHETQARYQPKNKEEN